MVTLFCCSWSFMPMIDLVSASILVLQALTHPSLELFSKHQAYKFISLPITVASVLFYLCFSFLFFRILRGWFSFMLMPLVTDTDLLLSGRILLANMKATLHLLFLGSTGLSTALMFLILSSILSLLGQT